MEGIFQPLKISEARPLRARTYVQSAVLHLGVATAMLVVQTTPLAPQQQGAKQRASLVIAAGSPDGNYSLFANSLANAIEQEGSSFSLVVKSTGGSYENADLLRQGKVDLALIQSDVAFLERYQERSFVGIAVLFPETIHVVARRELGLDEVHNIKENVEPQRISVGPKGSGTAAHGLTVLEFLEIPTESVLFLSTTQALLQLKERQVDVVFVTSSVPNNEIDNELRSRVGSLLRFDRKLSRPIRRANFLLSPSEITVADYSAIQQNVASFSVWALLATRRGLERETVEQLIDVIERRSLTTFGQDLVRSQEHSTVPFHPAAADHYSEASVDLSLLERARKILEKMWPLLAGILSLLILRRVPRFSYLFYEYLLGRVLAVLLIVWASGSWIMYSLESEKNAAFRTFGRSSLATIHYLVSGGLESKYPVTPLGNAASILILVVGAAALVFFSGQVVSWLVERALNLKRLSLKPRVYFPMRDHIIFAGWSERSARLLRQLRSKDLSRRPQVVVITPNPLQARVQQARESRGTMVVEGNPWEENTLIQADVTTAKAAVVMAPKFAKKRDQLSSIATTLAIENAAPSIHTIVEVGSPDLARHLNITEADEIIETWNLSARMISQAVITRGITRFYDEILSFKKDSQEIYSAPVPPRLVGLTFRQIQEYLFETRVLPIGIRPQNPLTIKKNTGSGKIKREKRYFLLNPSGFALTAMDALKAADELVYLADCSTDLRRAMLWQKISRKKVRQFPEGETSMTKKERQTIRIGICGWSSTALEIVRQLQTNVIAKKKRFVVTVITNRGLSEAQADEIASAKLRDVTFILADATKEKDLKRAGLREFQTLVILASGDPTDEGSKYLDHRSLLVALSADRASKGEALHQVVEVIDSANVEHFRRINHCEIVSVEDLTERVLAQAVITPGITRVVLRLLTATSNSNEVYFVDAGQQWTGQTFESLQRQALERGAAFIPVGYETITSSGKKELVLNPRSSPSSARRKIYVFGKNDRAVLIAYEEPDLQQLKPG